MSETTTAPNFKPLGSAGVLLALVGLVVVFIGWDASAMQSYLYGWYFWAAVTLGCFAITLLHHTLRATWGLSVLRLAEAGGGPEALGLTALGYLPILFNLKAVYPWASTPVHGKEWWLNESGFMLRFFLYFIVFIGLAFMLRASSRKQDETLDPKLGEKRHTIGPIGLVVFFVVMTFAVTDWAMSLESHFSSSMLPLLTAIGSALSAMAILVILLLANRTKEPYRSIVTPALTKDLGNMLFALTCLWQYMTLSQYLIIYSGNLPEEVPYYIRRNEGGWSWFIGAIIVLQFFVPFLALLAPRLKRSASQLLMVAALIFVVRIFDIHWQILPSLRCAGASPEGPLQSLAHIKDWAALLGFGGIWLAAFGLQVHRAALLPKHDTRLLEAEHAH